jgi:hypothetical protein
MKIRTLGPISEFKGQYGPMKSYSVQFEGSDDWITINQKPESPAPIVGQEEEGTVEDTPYGKRFKRLPKVSGSFQKSYSKSLEEITSIQRQTALTRAVEAVYNFNTLKGSDLSAIKLTDYSNAIIIVASRFTHYLETGQVQDTVNLVDQKSLDGAKAFDQALTDINSEEIQDISEVY